MENLTLGIENGSMYIVAILFLVFIIIVGICKEYYKNYKIKQKILKLANNEIAVTPEEFFKVRNTKLTNDRRKNISSSYKIAGIYIIYNKTKNMYYIGQSINVMNRVNSHFTGKGNGDVYADYKYGNEFTIKIITVLTAELETLNQLERETIRTYSAYSNGYNKTRGNKSHI